MVKNKEKIIISLIIGMMFLVLAMVIFIQFKTIRNTDINALEIMQESELRKEIASLKAQYDETLSKLEETNAKIKDYQETINTDKEASEILQEELVNSRNLVGKNAVQGEGVIVTLTDVEVGKFGKITASDLLDLVNTLKASGAEAISINGQRIIYSSYIVDIDSGYITVNGRRLVSPYEVQAVGDITYLESGLSQKQYGFIDSKTNEGKSVVLEKSSNILINAYTKELKFKYAKEVTQ